MSPTQKLSFEKKNVLSPKSVSRVPGPAVAADQLRTTTQCLLCAYSTCPPAPSRAVSSWYCYARDKPKHRRVAGNQRQFFSRRNLNRKRPHNYFSQQKTHSYCLFVCPATKIAWTPLRHKVEHPPVQQQCLSQNPPPTVSQYSLPHTTFGSVRELIVSYGR